MSTSVSDLPHGCPPSPTDRPDPAYEILSHCDDREKWLKDRETGIGASEVSTILGYNPFESEFTLYQIRTGVLPPKPEDHFTSWGKRLEASIATAYGDETKRHVARDGWLRRSRQYPWLLATPDYLFSDAKDNTSSGVLECKNTGERYHTEWDEDAPVRHQLQLQQQLIVLGTKRGAVAGLIGGNLFRWKDYPEHARSQKLIVQLTWAFWQRIQGQLPAPPPDDTPSTSRTLQKLLENGTVVELPDEVLAWHEAALKFGEDEKLARERKEEYRRKIEAVLGQASYGILPGDAGAYKFVSIPKKEHVVAASSSRVLTHLASKWSVVR